MRRIPTPPVLGLSLTAVALILAIGSCSGDGDGGGGTTQPPETGTVSGEVTAAGAGVAGATMTLSQGSTTRTTTSASSGAYSFSSVEAGSWSVAIGVPAGFALAAGQAASVPVTVTGGQTATADFALMSTLSSIRATVNVGDEPRSDVTLRLFDAGGNSARATQSTNASGVSIFTALAAAAYDVEVVPPTGLELEEGETARKRVTTTAGAEASVGFALAEVPSAGVVEVELSGISFQPSDVTISPGTTVRWIYRSGGPHTVTPDGHSTWTSATLTAPDQTFEHTFTTAGTFAYYCSPHRGAGMTGVIRVQ
ncbi:MAG TPA: SdrD B-like domain-containing protein [Longimicrobiales bacterium]|nr:SdrD B-like domain-containing protein [Longimicrobiales bacterium]